MVFAYSLGVRKSLFRLGTRISFGVMTICSCCGDEGIYGRSFLSKYAFIIRHRNIYGLSTISWWVEKFVANKMSFYFLHHCISKLWLFVQAPVDFFLNSLWTKLFISYQGCIFSMAQGYNSTLFPCRKQKSNKLIFKNVRTSTVLQNWVT